MADLSTTDSQHPRKREAKAENGARRDLKYPDLPEPLAVPCYDNHTHLEIEDGETGLEIGEHMDLAEQVNILGAITVGGDVASSRWQVWAANEDARLLAAVAIHPNEAPHVAAAGNLDAHLAQIAELAQDARVAAVGETGLDFFRTSGDEAIAAQYESFEAHIAIAKACGLPMQIHDRDAHDAVVETLRRVGAPAGTVFHCFSGDAELARIAAAEGWYCSFAGNVTFKNAQNLRDALEVLPPELVLVETDAPFLTPVPLRGRPNAPYVIPNTIRFMADHLGVEVDEFATRVAENTLGLYGPFDPTERTAWLEARRG
ncbi:TatD family hydrolase [Gulosibacter molinativorax]|uniref:TatD family deoxyribonuclease n=1 Tax=Gulosibacter molinativorax TaxID=256821 RepID=A0ABT7C6L3_9MICO|nr:TatD family hydrolase [Gulosibacter molinativorax]MDJ1370851.1 TatD family deoxyribonuclease [Gulosibacter molinativorax]QUY62189.1 Putative deoxyribonuclease YcfH [Gulosibacter molinativorax]